MGSGGCPPSPVSGRVQKACAPAWGVPHPSPYCWGPPPPLPPAPECCAMGTHAALGGAPYWGPGLPSPPFPCSHAVRLNHTLLRGGSICVLRVPPSLPCMPCAGRACCLGRGGPQLPGLGAPPLPLPLFRALGAHAAVRGVPPFLCPRAALRGCARPNWGAPPSSFLRVSCTRCWGGVPPSSTWFWPRDGGPRCRVWGTSPVLLLCTVGAR